jgi:ribosomal protein S12 methylthiotransferase accessory factor
MDIQFTGGLRVEALHNGYRIRTDQPTVAGGDGTAPSPFDLFLASIGTCAAYYALRFHQLRNLDTEGLAVSLQADPSEAGRQIRSIRIEVVLPPKFPEKYREAILRAIDQCAVKRHLVEPPAVEIVTIPATSKREHRPPSIETHRAAPPCAATSVSVSPGRFVRTAAPQRSRGRGRLRIVEPN